VTYKSVVAGYDTDVFAGAYPTLPVFILAQAQAALADGLGQAAQIALEASVATAESQATISLSSNNAAVVQAFTEANTANAQSLIGVQAQIQRAFGNATAQAVESSQLAQMQFTLATAQVVSDQDRLNTNAANDMATPGSRGAAIATTAHLPPCPPPPNPPPPCPPPNPPM
jgi:hypothetical protein